MPEQVWTSGLWLQWASVTWKGGSRRLSHLAAFLPLPSSSAGAHSMNHPWSSKARPVCGPYRPVFWPTEKEGEGRKWIWRYEQKTSSAAPLLQKLVSYHLELNYHQTRVMLESEALDSLKKPVFTLSSQSRVHHEVWEFLRKIFISILLSEIET